MFFATISLPQREVENEREVEKERETREEEDVSVGGRKSNNNHH